MSKTMLGISTGKGFLEMDENGVLRIGDYKIPIHQTIFNDVSTYYSVSSRNETICTVEGWDKKTLLQIVYAVDTVYDGQYVEPSSFRVEQMIGGKGVLAHIDGDVLKWNGLEETGYVGSSIYRIDKVIV